MTQSSRRGPSNQRRKFQAERDLLVAILSAIYPSHIVPAQRPGLLWTELVCIHTPAGVLAWGLPVDRLDAFKHLSRGPLGDSSTCEIVSVQMRTERLKALPDLITT